MSSSPGRGALHSAFRLRLFIRVTALCAPCFFQSLHAQPIDIPAAVDRQSRAAEPLEPVVTPEQTSFPIVLDPTTVVVNERQGDISALITRAHDARVQGDYEVAVEKYEEALTMIDRQKEPLAWRQIQIARATAYDGWAVASAGNGEGLRWQQAAESYREILATVDKVSEPLVWAGIARELGHTLEAIADTKLGTEHLSAFDEAAALFSDVLRIVVQKHPALWADTQGSLGSILYRRAKMTASSQRQPYLDQAIAAYRAALEIRTRENSLTKWASICDNLGLILIEKAKLSTGPDLLRVWEEAIVLQRNAMEAFELSDISIAKALRQGSLAKSLGDFAVLQSDVAQRKRLVDEALQLNLSALATIPRRRSPANWAYLQYHLGEVLTHKALYSDRTAASRFTEQAIVAYRAALEIYTRTDRPFVWAETQRNVASRLMKLAEFLPPASRAASLEEAVSILRSTQEIYTRQLYPSAWALSQSQLAGALADRAANLPAGEKFSAFTEALSATHAALEIFTRDGSAYNWAVAQSQVAMILNKQSPLAPTESERRALLQESLAISREVLAAVTPDPVVEIWLTAQYNAATSLGLMTAAAVGEEKTRLREQAIAQRREIIARAPRDDVLGNPGIQYREIAMQLHTAAAATAPGPARRELLAAAASELRRAIETTDRSVSAPTWFDHQRRLASVLVDLALASPSSERDAGLREASGIYDMILDSFQDSALAWRAEVVAGRARGHWHLAQMTEGDEQERLLKSVIEDYRIAVALPARADRSQPWALHQVWLADALRARGSRATEAERKQINLEIIACYRASLEVFTSASAHDNWVRSQLKLAEALAEQTRHVPPGERPAVFGEASAICRNLLEKIDRDAEPALWADTQSAWAMVNLYRATERAPMPNDERIRIIAESISAYEAALEIYTSASSRTAHDRTQRRLQDAKRAQDRMKADLASGKTPEP